MRRLAHRILLVTALLATTVGAAMAAEPITGRASVIDGGTLRIGDNVVRLFGMIAPSARQKCRRGSLPWLCGAASRDFLIRLTKGQQVICTKVKKSTASRCVTRKHDLAEQMIRNGWAVADRQGKGYRGSEEMARRAKIGLWREK